MANAKNNEEVFTLTREFDAPRDLVFEVWTNPKHFSKWFSPKGFTPKFISQDIRVGGITHYCMTSPDGTEVWGKTIYQEITKPTKLVYLQQFSNPEGGMGRHPMSPTWPPQMLTTIEFEAVGNKTKIVLTWKPVDASKEEMDTFIAAKPGMSQGWGGTFENLDAYLEEVRNG
jgi:uncharacterized protein YndB with AHSA1/START domain